LLKEIEAAEATVNFNQIDDSRTMSIEYLSNYGTRPGTHFYLATTTLGELINECDGFIIEQSTRWLDKHNTKRFFTYTKVKEEVNEVLNQETQDNTAQPETAQLAPTADFFACFLPVAVLEKHAGKLVPLVNSLDGFILHQNAVTLQAEPRFGATNDLLISNMTDNTLIIKVLASIKDLLEEDCGMTLTVYGEYTKSDCTLSIKIPKPTSATSAPAETEQNEPQEPITPEPASTPTEEPVLPVDTMSALQSLFYDHYDLETLFSDKNPYCDELMTHLLDIYDTLGWHPDDQFEIVKDDQAESAAFTTMLVIRSCSDDVDNYEASLRSIAKLCNTPFSIVEATTITSYTPHPTHGKSKYTYSLVITDRYASISDRHTPQPDPTTLKTSEQ
jgi:hypothetical protein